MVEWSLLDRGRIATYLKNEVTKVGIVHLGYYTHRTEVHIDGPPPPVYTILHLYNHKIVTEYTSGNVVLREG